MVGSEHAGKECVAGGGLLQGLLEMGGGGLGASPRSQRAEEMGGAFHAKALCSLGSALQVMGQGQRGRQQAQAV